MASRDREGGLVPTSDPWYRHAQRALAAEQTVLWPDMAETRCPFCAVEDHWNHRMKDGSCNSVDRVHDERCACSWRDE